MISAEQATQALSDLRDAGSDRSLLDLGWLDQVRVSPPRAVIRLNLPGFAQGQRDRIVNDARTRLLRLEGIEDVQIEVGQPPSQGASVRQDMDKPRNARPFPA